VVACGVEVEVAGGAEVVVGGAGFWVANMAVIIANTARTTTIAIAVDLETPRIMRSIILSPYIRCLSLRIYRSIPS